MGPLFFKQKDSLDRVMYSVLRVKTAEQAHELHTQIEEMESSFSDLVSEYSIGTEKNFNGIIGPVELGRLDPALAERLKISKTLQKPLKKVPQTSPSLVFSVTLSFSVF